MARYALTIFLSAFLLFQIQPIVARIILPRFGGTSAVWTTCMMYFQILLLVGYVYAHLVRRILTPRTTWLVHIILLTTAALTLRIEAIPDQPIFPSSNLAWSIIQVLTLTIGLPFLALSTTGPLVQAWHSTTHPQRQTYRLYALSNLGSMLALLSYPFLVERFFGLSLQQTSWSIAFLFFAALSAWSGWQTVRYQQWCPADADDSSLTQYGSSSRFSVVSWLTLSGTASVVLLATTNLMCLEVASYPFLWILPLTLYLLTLIICFDRPSWYLRGPMITLFLFSAAYSVLLVHLGTRTSLLVQVTGMSAVCFFGSMVCHGELQRLKPPTSSLTLFYLCIAIGGALGGIFVALIAPHIFDGYYEFHVGLILAILLPMTIIYFELRKKESGLPATFWLASLASMLVLSVVSCSLIYHWDHRFQPNLIFRQRSHYGIVSVLESNNFRRLVNGQTVHGGQSLDQSFEFTPNLYYVNGSGAATAFQAYRDWLTGKGQGDQPMNIGVVGLGTGSLSAWGKRQDRFCFYELDPLVTQVARDYFTFVEENDVEIVNGDGRIELEKELVSQGPRMFDILFIDAFSSDSIPVHLLTTECLELYRKHLKPDGILVLHITNKFVDLRPVVHSLAKKLDWHAVLLDHDNPVTGSDTRWVVLTRNAELADSPRFQQARSDWPEDLPSIIWTDDFASLAPLVIWNGGSDWIAELRQARQQDGHELEAK
ncbi:MAG: fused MFS/spermidine synthase [Mariniblastus sp.]|nr:fused MFS/spermidine synthase [Mariniblastus sp.]